MHFPLMQYLTIRNRSWYAGLFLVFIALVSLAGPALADQVADLYEATVPVANQSRAQRVQAIQQGFIEVLVRVSGTGNVGDPQQYPDIVKAAQSATRYVQQYQYIKSTPQQTGQQTAQETPQQSQNSQAQGQEGQQGGLALWVRFDETAIAQLLRANNLPVWGRTRPATLVWLVVDDHGNRKILGADSRNDAYTDLEAEAKLRGIPLRLPLLDLTDRTNIHTGDIWGNFANVILQASQRYQTESVLVGRVFLDYDGSWVGRWTLYVDSGIENWTAKGASLASVLNPGIDKTSELLALRYGEVDQERTGNVLVEVEAIKGLADYNRVMNYLQSISHVTDVQPVELMADSAVFRVTIPGGRLAVARAVALRHVLASDVVSTPPIESISAETATSTPMQTQTQAETTTSIPTQAGTATSIPTQAGTATSTPTQAGTATSTPTQAETATSTPTQTDPGKVVPELVYRLVP